MDPETKEKLGQLKELIEKYQGHAPWEAAIITWAVDTIERLHLSTMNQRSWVDTERLARIATIAGHVAAATLSNPPETDEWTVFPMDMAETAIAIERGIREAVGKENQ